MTPNQALADRLRRRQLYLMRHQASFRAEIDRFLVILGKGVAATIISVAPSEPLRAAYRTQRVEKLIDEVSALTAAAYREMYGYSVAELTGLAEVESLYLLKQVNNLLDRNISNIALPTSAASALVKTQLINGSILKDWWDHQSVEFQNRFAQEMRIGILGNESDAQLVSRVRGTAGLGFKDGMVEMSRRRARILVRGASSSVVSATRTKAIIDNPRLFEGIQQVSVLDGRTSLVCCSYAGKAWQIPGYKPIGHALPYNGGVPRHPNCRSTEIPVIRRELGGPPDDDVSFEEFTRNMPAKELDGLLGKGRAQLYRDGKITLSDLVDQHGRPLTLDQLREID